MPPLLLLLLLLLWWWLLLAFRWVDVTAAATKGDDGFDAFTPPYAALTFPPVPGAPGDGVITFPPAALLLEEPEVIPPSFLGAVWLLFPRGGTFPLAESSMKDSPKAEAR